MSVFRARLAADDPDRGAPAAIGHRRRVALLVVVLTATLAIASPAAGRPASLWGLRAGVASANLSSDSDSAAVLGSVAGAWLRAEGRRFGVSLEALYVRQGCENIVQGGGYAMDGRTLLLVRQDLVLDYLQLPLLAHARLGGTPLRLMAGPAVGFLLGSKTTFVDDARQEIIWGLDRSFWWTQVGSLDHVPPADVSLWLGAAVEVRIAGRPLGLTVHYQRGLRDLDPTVRSVHNRVLMGSLAVGL